VNLMGSLHIRQMGQLPRKRYYAIVSQAKTSAVKSAPSPAATNVEARKPAFLRKLLLPPKRNQGSVLVVLVPHRLHLPPAHESARLQRAFASDIAIGSQRLSFAVIYAHAEDNFGE
jgi:hypothetical protein